MHHCHTKLEQQHKDSTLIILGDFNAKHPMSNKNTKKPNKNGKLMADLIDRHNLIIQNDGNNTYCHPNGQSIIDLVLTRSIENVCCSTKKLDLITTLYNGIEIKIQQNINKDTTDNIKYKTKDANWESWKQSILDSLDNQLKGINILNINDIDNAISLLTKTTTDCANQNLGIVKDSKHSKNWWTKKLTAYENHTKLQKKLNYRSTESNERELKKSKKALQKLINHAKGELKKIQTEYLNSSKDSQEFWHRFNKIQNNKGKNIVEPLQAGKINTCSLIQKYQIYILKETYTDISKSNNNFDDNFKINLENNLKEIINSNDLIIYK